MPAVASTLLASLKSVKYKINILHGLFILGICTKKEKFIENTRLKMMISHSHVTPLVPQSQPATQNGSDTC